MPFRGKIPPQARDELVTLCWGGPLWFATWRAEVSEEVTILDASISDVTQACWPDGMHFKDISTLAFRDMVKFHATHPRVTRVLMGKGAPCQDLSSSKVGRQGLRGPQSRLFYCGMEAIEKLKGLFPFLDTHFFIEQVASAPGQDVQATILRIGCRPPELDAALVSWNDRRRL